jgi:hypothetical protein
MDSYPTPEDALFDIVNFLNNHNINIEKEWSDIGIKNAFLKKLTDEQINSVLQKLVELNFLSKRAGSGKKTYYKILKTF